MKEIWDGGHLGMSSLLYKNLMVVVIDMQPSFYPIGYKVVDEAVEMLLRRQDELIKWSQAKGRELPVVVAKYCHEGELDKRLSCSLGVCKCVREIEKPKDSLFLNESEELYLPHQLRESGIEERKGLILTGINSTACVADTWHDSVGFGYEALVCDDLHMNAWSGGGFVGNEYVLNVANREKRKQLRDGSMMWKSMSEMLLDIDRGNDGESENIRGGGFWAQVAEVFGG